MVLVGAFNAVARYASRFVGVNLSSNAFIEAQWYLFSVVFLFAGADALRRNAHVRVDVFYGRLGPWGKAVIDLGGTVLFLLPFCIFGIWSSMPSVLSSWEVWEVSPDPGGLPRYPLRTAVPIAFALLFLQGLAELARNLRRLRNSAVGEPDGSGS